MSLFRSAPQGLSQLGGWPVLWASLGLCLAPVVLGGVALLLLRLSAMPANAHPIWEGLGFLGLIWPLITAPLLCALAVIAAILLKFALYGAVQTILLGLALGGIAQLQTGIPVLAFYGLTIACLHRLILALIRPEAF